MTPKQQKALLALLTHPTKEQAAAAAGITPKTLRSYLADPAFRAEYREAFSSLVEDGDESPQFRISAARSILEYSLKLTEQNDILATLQELEAEVKKERK